MPEGISPALSFGFMMYSIKEVGTRPASPSLFKVETQSLWEDGGRSKTDLRQNTVSVCAIFSASAV